jgi:23S rRNA (cytosine1962-C5)-methyltransferase
MLVATEWKEYALLDAGNGEKLERWGNVILQRPDPQAIWPAPQWTTPDARYIRNESGGGFWQRNHKFPAQWGIHYSLAGREMTLLVEPTGFKHTGIFPEQAVNWIYMTHKIVDRKKNKKPVRILNLFAYTGAATIACALAGSDEIVHLDASKGMIQRAKEHAHLNGCQDRYIRFIVDDANKFVDKEIRRGRKYEGIIMDPPSYGRGPSGELWKLEETLFDLVKKSTTLLSEQPLFFIINSYTAGFAPTVLTNLLMLTAGEQFGGTAYSEEIGLAATQRPIILPCGCTAKWEL